MSETYEILVCPVCLEQSYEEFGYEAESPDHFHDEWGTVEPVRVKVELPPTFKVARDLALFRLSEQKREQAFGLAERRVYENLPQEEKERLHAERLAAMSPMERALHHMVTAQLEDTRHALNHQSFDWKGSYTVIPIAGSTEPERSG